MLTKVRWRFITAAMLAFFLVIALIASLVNIVNYYVVAGKADDTIETIITFVNGRQQGDIERRGGAMPPMGPFRGLPDEESNYMTRFFVVVVDSNNNVISKSMDYVASINETEASTFANDVLSKNSDRGFIRGYRFIKRDSGDKTVIVFLNSAKEIQSMRSLLIMTLAISGGSLLLVFILVVLLSKRAIRPIAQNMEIQKRFITDASHELKTPITSISTSLDVIEIENGSDEWTDNIRRQIGRMTGLVSEMVTLSRLDEVKSVPDKESVDLSSLVWEIVEIYNPQAKAGGKEIKTDIEDNVTIIAGKDSIGQMLSVLVDNAIRYSDDKGNISLTLKRSHGKAKIVVYNTCNYAKAPDVARLFDRFYRPDESRSSATGGNGIGLAIAKSAAESAGGKISASCPDGKSMTITVII